MGRDRLNKFLETNRFRVYVGKHDTVKVHLQFFEAPQLRSSTLFVSNIILMKQSVGLKEQSPSGAHIVYRHIFASGCVLNLFLRHGFPPIQMITTHFFRH